MKEAYTSFEPLEIAKSIAYLSNSVKVDNSNVLLFISTALFINIGPEEIMTASHEVFVSLLIISIANPSKSTFITSPLLICSIASG